MTRDINTSMRSAIAPTSAPEAPDAPPRDVVSMVASLPHIEAEEKLVVQTMGRADELTLELNDLNAKLSGELSHYTRDAVEGMNERALEIEQQLETLKNPPSALVDDEDAEWNCLVRPVTH